MPLYEFECTCGESKELPLSISGRNKVQNCDVCGSVLTRVISCKIERVEPVYLDSMKLMLPKHEQVKVHDRHSFRKALDRSGLITI